MSTSNLPEAKPPIVETPRLRLCPFELTDAPAIERLAGDRRVAATTLRIPHPYPSGAAVEFIEASRRGFAVGESCNLAVRQKAGDRLIGAIGLTFEPDHRRAELGYWISFAEWGQGYATEAVAAMVRFGFESYDLNRIYAHCFSENRASARVLTKIGMRHEGSLRQHVRKWERFVDIEFFGILREERS